MSIFTDMINPVTGLSYNPLGNITEPLKSITIEEAEKDPDTYKITEATIWGAGKGGQGDPGYRIKHLATGQTKTISKRTAGLFAELLKRKASEALKLRQQKEIEAENLAIREPIEEAKEKIIYVTPKKVITRKKGYSKEYAHPMMKYMGDK